MRPTRPSDPTTIFKPYPRFRQEFGDREFFRLEVYVLGSGGFMPFPDAHMPGFLVREQGQNFLFDTGEGTQTRIVEAGLSHADLRSVFVSHLHGDHVLGLPGVLIRRSREGDRDTPLQLIGPGSLERFLEGVMDSLGFGLTFPLEVSVPGEGDRRGTELMEWMAVSLIHRTETYGFCLQVKKTKRKFHPDRARELGVPEGPLWGRLQKGQEVQLKDGRRIRPDQVSDPPPPGAKFVYLPDTRPLEDFPSFFRNPDLLVHEAMFLEADRDHAVKKQHSTAREAAEVARDLNADHLLLTHVSRRYENPDELREEARQIFEKTRLARDGMKLEVTAKDS